MIYPCQGILEDCTCTPIYPNEIENVLPEKPSVLPVDDGMLPLTGSVGAGGQNFPADVTTIQDALNRVPADQGRATPLLVVDGKCGPMTRSAIQKFQLKHFGWSGADSRIDVGKQTHLKLSSLVKTGPKYGMTEESFEAGASTLNVMPSRYTPAQLVVKKYLDTTRAAVAAARLQASVALMATILPDVPQGGLQFLNRKKALELANRHFSLLQFQGEERTDAARRILTIFERMDSLFSKPGMFGGLRPFLRQETAQLRRSIWPTHGMGATF